MTYSKKMIANYPRHPYVLLKLGDDGIPDPDKPESPKYINEFIRESKKKVDK